MDFRRVDKERVTVTIPIALATKLRENAVRRTLSEVVTESLCRQFGVPPESYGIKRRPRPRVSAN